MRAIVWLAISIGLATSARADLVINLEEMTGNGVRMELSGSGTVDTGGGANPGATLDFLNFSGNPFALSLPTTSSNFSLSGSTAAFLLDGATTSPVTTFRTQRSASAGGSDIDLLVSQAISNGQTFVASGSATIDGLLFSDLNVGVYTSSDGDSSDFGDVTLNISPATAVPEAQSLLVVLLASAGLLRHRPLRS